VGFRFRGNDELEAKHHHRTKPGGGTSGRAPRLKDYVEYLALRGAMCLLGLVPLRVGLRVGAFVGEIFFRFDVRNRRVAMQNLGIAFPDKSDEERRAILLRSCRNLGRLAAEVCHFPRLTAATIGRYVTVDDPQTFRRSLAIAAERGALVLTGHVGNFELLAYAHGLLGHPITLVHRSMRNPLVDRLIGDFRSRAGTVSLPKSAAARSALRALRRHQTVAIPADQNQVRRMGVFADFFGLAACTTPGPARLAMHTEAPIFPVFLIREGETERHRIVVLPPVELAESGDIERDIVTNTERCNAVLEQILREYPEQWIWFHKRWKTRPEGEPKIYV
jgi:KDO2-lipid IV(A) lauroyltransferase